MIQNMKRLRDLQVTKPGTYLCRANKDDGLFCLSRSTHNRNIGRRDVAYLVGQIESGEWRGDHPQPIVFDCNGVFIDGHHRMTALAKTDCEIVVRVETGVDPKLRNYVDTGRVRPIRDRVDLVADPQRNKLACMVVTFIGHTVLKLGSRLSPDCVRSIFECNKPGIELAIDSFATKTNGVKIAAAMVAISEMAAFSEDIARDFANSMCVVDGPILQATYLRDYLLRNISLGGGVGNVMKYERCVYCMDAAIKNKKITKVLAGTWSLGSLMPGVLYRKFLQRFTFTKENKE